MVTNGLLLRGISVGCRVLQRLLRRAGYCYKRVRRSLRAKRPSARFAACQRLLRALHRRADQPQVWYINECRFSRQAPVSHAWQRRGASAVTVPAVRGKGGYSMLGFWCTEAATETPLFRWWTSETAFNATLWLAAVEDWLKTLRRRPCSSSITRRLIRQTSSKKDAPNGSAMA